MRYGQHGGWIGFHLTNPYLGLTGSHNPGGIWVLKINSGTSMVCSIVKSPLPFVE